MILHVVGTMSRLVQTAPKGPKAALTNFGRRGAEKPDDRYLVRETMSAFPKADIRGRAQRTGPLWSALPPKWPRQTALHRFYFDRLLRVASRHIFALASSLDSIAVRYFSSLPVASRDLTSSFEILFAKSLALHLQ